MNRDLLSKNGLSLSQAQAISNLVNQKAKDINAKIGMINNATETIKIDGEQHNYVEGVKMPENIKELIVEKARLHGLQAMLMEALKNKDAQLEQAQYDQADFNEVAPVKEKADLKQLIPLVTESWGWDQLTNEEYYEFLEKEAYASHIGQFIHKDGKLTKLRNELPNLPSIKFIEIDRDRKTPVKVNSHHNIDELSRIHEEFAQMHRENEQRVNYFKAKVKNLVTKKNSEIQEENAEISRENKALQEAVDKKYYVEFRDFTARRNIFEKEFEAKRGERVKEIASKRIVVPTRFKDLVDKFNKEDKDDQ